MTDSYSQQMTSPYLPHLLQTHGFSQEQQAKISGSMGVFMFTAMRNAVWELKQAGWNIEMEEGHGWIRRPFVLRGDLGAIKMLTEWMDRI